MQLFSIQFPTVQVRKINQLEGKIMDEKKQMLVKELVMKIASTKPSWHNDLSRMVECFPEVDKRDNSSIHYDRIEELEKKPLFIFGGETWTAFWDLPSNDEVFENILDFFETDDENGYKALVKEHQKKLGTAPKAVLLVTYSEELDKNKLYPTVLQLEPSAKPELFVVVNYNKK